MADSNIKDLLLAARLDPQQAAALLGPFGFKQPLKADMNLQGMASDPSERLLLAEILADLLAGMSESADPDQALTYFERFASAAINKTRLFKYLQESPRTIEILTRALGGSPYMAEILIRDPHHFYWVTDPHILHGRRGKRDIQRELVQTLQAASDEQKQLDYLRSVKRREMLRIGMRDLSRISSVEETLDDLSILAEALISAAYWISARALRREHSIPRTALTGFTVLAMGKLGGGELNFSSDVDLIYLYKSDDEEVPGMSAREFFRRISQKLTIALNEFTSEGYVYRVDLRLRPEGRDGNIADPLKGYERYYNTRLGTWERLALLKAWPVAGDRGLGQTFVDMTRAFVYERPFDAKALEDIRNMKRRTDQQMNARNQRHRNVKLGAGGIREIELIAQSLQVAHGSRIRELRERTTPKALVALRDWKLLSSEEYETLRSAYIFLRDVENKLQMVNDAQTHSLPVDPDELTTFSRFLGYRDSGAFMQDYRHHTAQVAGLFELIIGAPESPRFPSASA